MRQSLRSWFEGHARELPWRQTGPGGGRDPYRVWISEVLLQQTQVVRGRVYFGRFVQAFPTVRDLAAAPQEAVLKAWEGCGYYARARNLHRAAKQVADQGFPHDYAGWLALPGVGPYTAAAISSIAYGERRAVNDGNVRRVLARVFAQREPSEAWVQENADELLDPSDPGLWNEALMDLGATVCTPKNPDCGRCPWQPHCAAFASGAPANYPAPKKRAQVREWRGVALLIGDEHAAYLETREGSLLGGLSGLPVEVIEGEDTAGALGRLMTRLGASQPRFLGRVSHTMTHRQIQLMVYAAQAALSTKRVADQPLSRLDHKALSLSHQAQAPLLEA